MQAFGKVKGETFSFENLRHELQPFISPYRYRGSLNPNAKQTFERERKRAKSPEQKQTPACTRKVTLGVAPDDSLDCHSARDAALQLWSQRASVASPCPAGENSSSITTIAHSKADVWGDSGTCGPLHAPGAGPGALSRDRRHIAQPQSLLPAWQLLLSVVFRGERLSLPERCSEKACKASPLSRFLFIDWFFSQIPTLLWN